MCDSFKSNHEIALSLSLTMETLKTRLAYVQIVIEVPHDSIERFHLKRVKDLIQN